MIRDGLRSELQARNTLIFYNLLDFPAFPIRFDSVQSEVSVRVEDPP